MEHSQKKENEKKKLKKKTKSCTEININNKVKTNSENNKFFIRKAKTYNFRHISISLPNNHRNTIKMEDENHYEVILKKSKTLLLERNKSYNKFKAALETIHEVSNSKIDSSELSDYKEDTKNKNKNNDNNGQNKLFEIYL